MSDQNTLEVQKIIADILVKLGYEASIERDFTRPDSEEVFHFNIIPADEDQISRMVGRQEQTILALEHLVRQIARRNIENHPKIELDVAGTRHERDELLMRETREAVQSMNASMNSIELTPMDKRRRFLIHNLIREEFEGFETTAQGIGDRRRIKVFRSRTPREESE